MMALISSNRRLGQNDRGPNLRRPRDLSIDPTIHRQLANRSDGHAIDATKY
jgi:hypothetical protein